MTDLFDALDLAARALRGVKERPLYDANFDGTECKTVAEFAATNRCSELKAALYAWEHKDGALYDSACEYIKALKPGRPPEGGYGYCVVLVPERVGALQVAIQDGEPADNLHITLLYIAKSSGVPAENTVPGDQIAKLKEICHTIAADHGPFTASMNGITRFSGNDTDGLDPIVVNADSPQLPLIHADLVKRIEQEELPFQSSHGFTPHMTIGYVGVHEDIPIQRWAPIDIRIDRIELWKNGVVESWKLAEVYHPRPGQYDEPEGEPEPDTEEEPAIPVTDIGRDFANIVIDTYDTLRAQEPKDISNVDLGPKVERRKKIIERAKRFGSDPRTEAKS